MSLTRRLPEYLTIQELHETNAYPVNALCRIFYVARQAYYKWLKHPESAHEQQNKELSQKITEIYDLHPDKGHRRIRDESERQRNSDKQQTHVGHYAQAGLEVHREKPL